MTKTEIKKRISELKREIKYQNKKMEVCAYGKSDLYYVLGLENELYDLEQQLEGAK